MVGLDRRSRGIKDLRARTKFLHNASPALVEMGGRSSQELLGHRVRGAGGINYHPDFNRTVYPK